MKFQSNPFLRTLAFATLCLTLGQAAHAGGYQWNGTSTSAWSTPANWATTSGTFYGQTITAGAGPTGATYAHRLNVLNGAGSPLIYDSSLGTTVYANAASGLRGLVMSSGTASAPAPASAFTITGGSFSTLGSSAADAIGNSVTTGTTSVLTVDGGAFIGSGAGTIINFGGTNNVSTFNIKSGTATLTNLVISQSSGGSGTVNLDGGTLSVNKVSRPSSGTATFNFNGGTLKARQNDTAFITGLSAVNVNSAGAIIDTNGFDVTVGNILRDGGGGGGLTKNGTGTLTLTAAPTYTGATVVNAGTLALNAAGTHNNAISGAGNLAIGGAVTLGGTNTYLGATSVNSGALTLNGSLTSNITVAGGANLAGEGSTTGSVTFSGTSALSFDTSTPGAFTAASVNATGAAVTIAPIGTGAASGIVVLQAAGGITGTIGTEFIGSSRLSLYYNVGNTQLLANFTPATLTWKGNDLTNPTFWDSGLTTNWSNGGSPDTFLAGDNVTFDDTASEFSVAVQSEVFPGNITFNNTTNDYTVNGAAISGGGSLTKNGSGYLYLNTPNTYTGATNINAGMIVAGHNSALGSNTGGTTVSGTGVLDINNKNLGTAVITISGDGDGTGALVNIGGEQINAIGRLVLGADASIGGSGRWDLRNSTPTLDMGGFTLTKKGLNYVGLVGVTVANPGDIDVTEGTFSVQTSTTMGGSDTNTITVRSGAFLTSWQAANPTPWSLDLKNGSTLRSESAAVAANNTWTGPVTLENTGTVTIDAIGSMTIAGVISGTDSGITKTSAGVTYLEGTNTYTGATTVNAGGLVLRNTAALGSTGVGTTVNSTGRIELDNLTITGEAITITGDGGNFWGPLQGRAGISVWTGNVTVAANLARIGAQTGASLEVSGVIDSPTNHNLVLRPADLTSTVILSGANTYTGPTSIVGGVVSVSHIGSVSGGPSNFGAPTTVADGTIKMSLANATGLLRYTGTGETTDRVIDLFAPTNGAYLEQSGTGLLKFTSDLTATGAGTKNLALQGSTAGIGELAGAIVDNSATNKTTVTKTGTGTWVLSGINTFTGNVFINEGILRITNSNALGNTSKIVTINASANKWLELDGTGGTITLATNLGFQTSGVNGVIRNTAGDNVIASPITMTVGNGNTKILSDNSGSLTLNGNIDANTTDRVLDLGGNSTANNAFNGVLANANTPGLAKSDSGKWTLNGVNLYTGATTITGGTLVIGATGSIDASASLAISAGATLDTTAKSSHTLPAAVSINVNGDTATCGLINAAGQALDIDGAAVTFDVTGTLAAPVYVLANYGSISGTPAFASATPPTGYTLDYTYNGGTQIALVQSGSDYDTWMNGYPSITGSDKLPGADPDGDGLTNFEEYAFGLAPNSGASVNPISQPLSKTTGIFKYTRRATPASTGVTYTFESSTTLNGAWTPFTPDSATSDSNTPVEEITVDVPDSLLSEPAIFIRVKAVKP